MDILPNKLRYARKFGSPLVNASIWSLPFADKTFDSVICSEVIEHIASGLQPFREMRRVLKPNGVLIVGTPDYEIFVWRWIEYFYKLIVPGVYAFEHITRYTFQSLADLLTSLGFRVEKHSYILFAELIVRCSLSEKGSESLPERKLEVCAN